MAAIDRDEVYVRCSRDWVQGWEQSRWTLSSVGPSHCPVLASGLNPRGLQEGLQPSATGAGSSTGSGGATDVQWELLQLWSTTPAAATADCLSDGRLATAPGVASAAERAREGWLAGGGCSRLLRCAGYSPNPLDHSLAWHLMTSLQVGEGARGCVEARGVHGCPAGWGGARACVLACAHACRIRRTACLRPLITRHPSAPTHLIGTGLPGTAQARRRRRPPRRRRPRRLPAARLRVRAAGHHPGVHLAAAAGRRAVRVGAVRRAHHPRPAGRGGRRGWRGWGGRGGGGRGPQPGRAHTHCPGAARHDGARVDGRQVRGALARDCRFCHDAWKVSNSGMWTVGYTVVT